MFVKIIIYRFTIKMSYNAYIVISFNIDFCIGAGTYGVECLQVQKSESYNECLHILTFETNGTA